MNARTRLTSICAAVTVVAVTASACSSSAVDARTKAVRNSSTVALKKSCSPSTCAGTRGGAAYLIRLPSTKWNGTLLLWSHGYRVATAVPSDPLDPTSAPEAVNRAAELAPAAKVADELLSQGYALAGSAFATNGWDVQDGVKADNDLYSYFASTFGKPNRVYAWGDSLGGLITQTLAETNPTWISGVAPMCGVLAGTNYNLDLALDVAYAVKMLIDPTLQLTGYASADAAVAQWVHASRALAAAVTRAGPADIANLFAIAAIAGAPTKTENYDGSTVTSQAKALVQSLITALGYSTWGRYDIEQRVGGNPSQNVAVDYSARIGTTYQALIGNQIVRIRAALAAGQRVSADPAARAKAATLGNPTGVMHRPTITLHTEYDPLVLVQNESVFGNRVAAHNGGGQLVQLYTTPPLKFTHAPYGAGHCNFTPTEYVGVITLLDKWVRLGVYAGPGGVANALDYTIDNTQTDKNTPAKVDAGTSTTGYDPNFAAPAWPAKVG